MEISVSELLKGKINVSRKVPVRKWSIDWPLPDKFEVEKYTTKLISNGKESFIGRYRLLGRMGKEIPKAKKWYRGNKSRIGLEYFVKDGYVWCTIKHSFQSILEIEKCKLSRDDNWLYLEVPKEYVGIWYYKNINSPNFIIVPEFIELDDLFFQTIGILTGEMTKKDTIEIGNVEPAVINTIIDWFTRTKIIPKGEFSFEININSREIPLNQRNIVSKDAKNFWAKSIGIQSEKIHSVHFYEKVITHMPENIGTLHVSFTHKCARLLIDHLCSRAKEIVVKDENYSIPFLQGLFAAEGEVGISENRVNQLRISSKHLEERNFYESVCKAAKINAKASLKTHHVSITGLWDILRCVELDIAKLHPERKRKLISCLNKMLSIKAMKTLTKSPLTVKEIAELLKTKDGRNLNKNLYNFYTN
ncbi:MAG TPA: hypothetical protein VJA47_00075 [archaeon]|nr:hypothetical protein [archaeon]